MAWEIVEPEETNSLASWQVFHKPCFYFEVCRGEPGAIAEGSIELSKPGPLRLQGPPSGPLLRGGWLVVVSWFSEG